MGEVDYYDVERMIRDAEQRLESRVDELERKLDRERAAREDADEAVMRVVNSRTEHLA